MKRLCSRAFEGDKVKITGTRSCLQIEDDNGNIAQFDGEVCLGGYELDADTISWIRHKGEATEQDRLDLIYRATRYGQEQNQRLRFFEGGRVLFETELGLKTEVYWPKSDLIIVAVVTISLVFPALLIAALGLVRPAAAAGGVAAAVLLAAPFLAFGVQVGRFRLTAVGDRLIVRPAVGRRYAFSASEITQVTRKIKRTSQGEELRTVQICTERSHVRLHSEMAGVEEMDLYLLRHVGREKITTKVK